MGVCMGGEHPPPRRLADVAGTSTVEADKMRNDLVRAGRHEHFPIGFEKCVEPFPAVGDETGGSTSGFEHARRRGEAVAGHAVPTDIEDRTGGAVERVVVGCIHVADVADVCWTRLVVPPV